MTPWHYPLTPRQRRRLSAGLLAACLFFDVILNVVGPAGVLFTAPRAVVILCALWLARRGGQGKIAAAIGALGLLASLGYGLVAVFMAALDPLIGLATVGLAGGLWACFSRAPRRVRVALALLPPFSANMTLFIFIVAVFHETPQLGFPLPEGREAYLVGEWRHPSQRYRFLISKDASRVRISNTALGTADILPVPELAEPLATQTRHNLNRFAVIDANVVVGCGPGFLVALDRRDFSTITERTLPGGDSVALRLGGTGLAYHEATGQVVMTRGDGEVWRFSWPGLELVSKGRILSEEESAGSSGLEAIFDATSPPGDDTFYVMATTGSFVAYDMATNRPRASRFLWGILSNTVFDDETAYVISFLRRRLFGLTRETLATQVEFPVAPGSRSLAMHPSGEALFVGNYFFGHVDVHDPATGRLLARFNAGPRIQWLQFWPDRPWLGISHAEGFTIVNADAILASGLMEEPLIASPLAFLTPAIVAQHFRIMGWKGGWEFVINASLALAIVTLAFGLPERTNSAVSDDGSRNSGRKAV